MLACGIGSFVRAAACYARFAGLIQRPAGVGAKGWAEPLNTSKKYLSKIKKVFVQNKKVFV